MAVIVVFNLAALSFYAPFISGPEQLLAGHPKVFAAIIGVHIIVGLAAIGFFARSHWRSSASVAQQGASADVSVAASRRQRRGGASR